MCPLLETVVGICVYSWRLLKDYVSTVGNCLKAIIQTLEADGGLGVPSLRLLEDYMSTLWESWRTTCPLLEDC
mgnify:CR=1 FL=1